MKIILSIGILITTLMLVVPNVYANESNAKRSSDGFNDGSNAARTDVTFNPACDPNSLHTSDGQHTATYCNAWTQGYTTTWNNLHPDQIQQTQTQTQQQSQKQNQRNICIAIICRNTQSGSQGQDQQSNQGNTP
jgi:hypothetical protein